jgi:hypothetical protein
MSIWSAGEVMPVCETLSRQIALASGPTSLDRDNHPLSRPCGSAWNLRFNPHDEEACARHQQIADPVENVPLSPSQTQLAVGRTTLLASLSRLAKSVKELGPVEVHDITFHVEVTADGTRPSMTVYYSLAKASRGE